VLTIRRIKKLFLGHDRFHPAVGIIGRSNRDEGQEYDAVMEESHPFRLDVIL
jgi:hypothetical protein